MGVIVISAKYISTDFGQLGHFSQDQHHKYQVHRTVSNYANSLGSSPNARLLISECRNLALGIA